MHADFFFRYVYFFTKHWGLIHTDARRDAHANWNVFPLVLLASSVNTPIDNKKSHLLVLPVRVLCELGLNPWSGQATFSGYADFDMCDSIVLKWLKDPSKVKPS